MTATSIALSAHLATHRIKLVHTWTTLGRVNAMLEWPYDPAARKPLTTERHATGLGSSADEAVIRGLELIGLPYDLKSRLWVMVYLMGRAV